VDVPHDEEKLFHLGNRLFRPLKLLQSVNHAIASIQGLLAHVTVGGGT
jgi:hypothetical protein